MKYEDILKDVFNGKWVRLHEVCNWRRLRDDGNLEYANGNICTPYTKAELQSDTWEVKQEEVYVWYAPETETKHAVLDFDNGVHTSRLKKYKLVPVED